MSSQAGRFARRSVLASQRMLDGPTFVKTVMDRLEVDSPAKLAEKMKWKRGTERLVAKWIAGDNRPSYGYMLDMIDAAGMLNSAGGDLATPEQPPDRLAKIEEGVAALLVGQDMLLAKQKLVRPEAPSAPRSPDQATPRTGSAGRG